MSSIIKHLIILLCFINYLSLKHVNIFNILVSLVLTRLFFFNIYISDLEIIRIDFFLCQSIGMLNSVILCLKGWKA